MECKFTKKVWKDTHEYGVGKKKRLKKDTNLKRYLSMHLYLGMGYIDFNLELSKWQPITYDLWNLKLSYLN